jgi:ABC-type multidrug transport system fused ATPase/permease subunit
VSTFKRIYAILTHSERKKAGALLGLTVVGMVLETLGIGLVIPTIAVLIRRDLGPSYPLFRPILRALGEPSQPQLIAMGMVALVALYLVKNVFLGYFAWRQNRFTSDVKAELSQRLFTIYLRQPYTFHLRNNSALLIRNVIGEASTFSGTLTHALNFVTEGVVLTSVAALLLVVEPVGTLVVVTILGGSAWGFYHWARIRIGRWGQLRHYHEGLLIQHLQQGLGGVKEMKLLGREAAFLAQFRVHNIQATRASELHATLSQFPRLWLELLAVTGLATLAISMLAQRRELANILPMLGLFGAAAFRTMPSVGRVLGAAQALRYGLPAIDTLYDELQRPLQHPEPVKRENSATFERDIRLTDVTYTYPGAASPALMGVTLTVGKGESVGFVGSSGAGKSTLVDIVLGLLTPDAGQVAVDGQEIQHALRNWQSQIGYVPQSIFLTDDTLRRNVAFGLAEDQIDDAAVERALEAAQLKEFVAGLPDGLETPVGERGVRLSGGQRQRIGIARALYHDPAVLVLDEATSALDVETERDVMQAVEALHGRKTILIVAHRLSTVAHCDRQYRLEQGRAEEQQVPGSMTAEPHA